MAARRGALADPRPGPPARRWGAHWMSLGAAGHINVESGHGPLPMARAWVRSLSQHLAREQRPEMADWREWSFAV